MSLYESVFIVRQELSPNEVNNIADKYISVIEKTGGKLIKKEDWGIRNLAYQIKNNRKGNYILFHLDSKSSTVTELERLFKIDDDIIRYLTTKVSEISDEPSDIIKDKLDKEENEKDSFKNYDNSDKNRGKVAKKESLAEETKNEIWW